MLGTLGQMSRGTGGVKPFSSTTSHRRPRYLPKRAISDFSRVPSTHRLIVNNRRVSTLAVSRHVRGKCPPLTICTILVGLRATKRAVLAPKDVSTSLGSSPGGAPVQALSHRANQRGYKRVSRGFVALSLTNTMFLDGWMGTTRR